MNKVTMRSFVRRIVADNRMPISIDQHFELDVDDYTARLGTEFKSGSL